MKKKEMERQKLHRYLFQKIDEILFLPPSFLRNIFCLPLSLSLSCEKVRSRKREREKEKTWWEEVQKLEEENDLMTEPDGIETCFALSSLSCSLSFSLSLLITSSPSLSSFCCQKRGRKEFMEIFQREKRVEKSRIRFSETFDTFWYLWSWRHLLDKIQTKSGSKRRDFTSIRE